MTSVFPEDPVGSGGQTQGVRLGFELSGSEYLYLLSPLAGPLDVSFWSILKLISGAIVYVIFFSTPPSMRHLKRALPCKTTVITAQDRDGNII